MLLCCLNADPTAGEESLKGLFSQNMSSDAACMWLVAMFPEVNPLPGAQGKVARDDGDAEVDGGQRGAHVGWHVILTFACVVEQRVAIGDQTREKTFQVTPDFRVGIFLDQQRGGRVAHMQRQETVGDAAPADPCGDLARDFIKPASACADREFVSALFHRVETMLTGPLASPTGLHSRNTQPHKNKSQPPPNSQDSGQNSKLFPE